MSEIQSTKVIPRLVPAVSGPGAAPVTLLGPAHHTAQEPTGPKKPAQPRKPAQSQKPAEPKPPAPPRPELASTKAGRQMEAYLQHLGVERGMARNTVSAYRRDLLRYAAYLEAAGAVAPTTSTPAPDRLRPGASVTAPTAARR